MNRINVLAPPPARRRRRARRPLAGRLRHHRRGPSIGRVVVVGGGFGGATAARYLRLWGGNVDVTLVERNASFVSCPISNLVLGGYKQIGDITPRLRRPEGRRREGGAGRGDGDRRRRQEGAPGRRQRRCPTTG